MASADLVGSALSQDQDARSRDRLSDAVRDLAEGVRSWRLWWLLGLNDIAQRYRRSALGQFWITASMAVFITALSLVYSTLFQMDVREYAPYLVVNIVVWNFISSSLTEACTVFTQAEGFLKQERLPKTLFPFRLLVRNFIVFAHNIVLIPFVFLYFGKGLTWTALAALPGLLLLLANAFFVILFLGMACARFRDLPQIVSNAIQIGFFVTPVMWRPAQVASAPWIVDWNPLANQLLIVSAPLHGELPSVRAYLFSLALLLILALITAPIFVRFRERIVYWL